MNKFGLLKSKIEKLLIESYVDKTFPKKLKFFKKNILENQPVATFIGTLTSTDPEGGAVTYSLVNGTGDSDNSSFIISGDSLLANSVFDYQTKSSYAIRVRATDNGGLYIEKEFTLNVLPNYIPQNGLQAYFPLDGNFDDIGPGGCSGLLGHQGGNKIIR